MYSADLFYGWWSSLNPARSLILGMQQGSTGLILSVTKFQTEMVNYLATLSGIDLDATNKVGVVQRHTQNNHFVLTMSTLGFISNLFCYIKLCVNFNMCVNVWVTMFLCGGFPLLLPLWRIRLFEGGILK